MISKALFIIVAESTVIFRPISHVGCANASSTVTFSIWSAVNFRNGPPLAVKTTVLTSSLAPPFKAWKMALCSLSTGNISAFDSCANIIARCPATTNVSLLAKATRLPAEIAAKVLCIPALPTIAAITISTSSHSATSCKASGPTCSSASRSEGQSNFAARSGSVAMIFAG